MCSKTPRLTVQCPVHGFLRTGLQLGQSWAAPQINLPSNEWLPSIISAMKLNPINICNPSSKILFLEVTIKSYKTCQLEDVIIILLLKLVAPMPSGCQPATNQKQSELGSNSSDMTANSSHMIASDRIDLKTLHQQ